MEKSRTHCSSFSHSLTLALSFFCSPCPEAKPKWVASTPYCITHNDDCCSDSVVLNQAHWTLCQGDLSPHFLFTELDKICLVSQGRRDARCSELPCDQSLCSHIAVQYLSTCLSLNTVLILVHRSIFHIYIFLIYFNN